MIRDPRSSAIICDRLRSYGDQASINTITRKRISFICRSRNLLSHSHISAFWSSISTRGVCHMRLKTQRVSCRSVVEKSEQVITGLTAVGKNSEFFFPSLLVTVQVLNNSHFQVVYACKVVAFRREWVSTCYSWNVYQISEGLRSFYLNRFSGDRQWVELCVSLLSCLLYNKTLWQSSENFTVWKTSLVTLRSIRKNV